MFCNRHKLLLTRISEPTYHHLMGNGKSDSNLDRIMYPSSAASPEFIDRIVCKLHNPLINSHHDLLLSAFSIQSEDLPSASIENVVAPIIENKRQKVIWSDAGIEDFQSLVVPHLKRLQELWLSQSPSKTTLSLFLESTNNVLTTCAGMTNQTINLKD